MQHDGPFQPKSSPTGPHTIVQITPDFLPQSYFSPFHHTNVHVVDLSGAITHVWKLIPTWGDERPLGEGYLK